AGIVVKMWTLAEVGRLRVVERGDDIPRHPTAEQMIESGEDPGDMKRLVVSRRVRGSQAEVLRGQSHGGKDGNQIHLDDANAMLDGSGEIVPVAVGHGEPVVAERQMELALFKGAGNALKVSGGEEIRRGGG